MENLYTIKEVAAYCKVSEATVYQWMRTETLSVVRIGGITRVTQSALDALIETCKMKADESV